MSEPNYPGTPALTALEMVRAARSAFSMEEQGPNTCEMCGAEDVSVAGVAELLATYRISHVLNYESARVYNLVCEACMIEQWVIQNAIQIGIPADLRILTDVTNNR
jgi:hypothetical protein